MTDLPARLTALRDDTMKAALIALRDEIRTPLNDDGKAGGVQTVYVTPELLERWAHCLDALLASLPAQEPVTPEARDAAIRLVIEDMRGVTQRGEYAHGLSVIGWYRQLEAVLLVDAGAEGPIACQCCEKKPATCFGVYEVMEQPITAACDDCCGHGNEDGWCRPIAEMDALKRFPAPPRREER